MVLFNGLTVGVFIAAAIHLFASINTMWGFHPAVWLVLSTVGIYLTRAGFPWNRP